MNYLLVLITFTTLIFNVKVYSQTNGEKTFNIAIVDDKEREVCVSLDRNIPTNDAHPLMDRFEDETEDYITWLYSLNKIWQIDSSFHRGPKVISEETLIFTIVKDGVTSLDTLNNAVDPDKHVPNFTSSRSWIPKIKRTNSKNLDRDIQGSLPRGSMSYIEAKRQRLECGILVSNSRSKVRVLIKNLQGEVIAILCDEYKLKGWSNFKWNRGKYPRGRYLLSFEVDGQSMTQKFKI